MEQMPLFPLNTVLFPGMPLNLHVFEDRYKLLLGDCISQQQPFGVLLLKTGAAEDSPGEGINAYFTGCSAVITRVQPLARDRMNIVAIGQDRFRVRSLLYDKPYITGNIEPQPFSPIGGYDRESATRLLQRSIERYAELVGQFGQPVTARAKLQDDPLRLAFLGATIVNAPAQDKQWVLQAESEFDVIRRAARLLRREITLLDILSRPFPDETSSKFSMN